ncbi:hypothetical protein PILCRDRAFT_13027 [Piloderma croceum F 1598]|uniref:Uncharacterized protein n=1 Tax=Piloderma croceum (strain F 1598) TaxID=765440 RepID=A0A0C3F8G7_PILCF|nr:hypothetical protein PILCRDRAFT_13027 [Piloderma croceum F 1598]
MSSATITNNSESNAAHPRESFRPSMDYQHFESTVIQPFLLQVKLCNSVNIHHHTSLSFAPAPGHPSLDGLIQLLSETDYNQNTPSKPLPSLPRSDVSSSRVEGYSSQIRPNYFIWEYGHFEEGLIVLLGGSSRLVKVLGVCGVGRNYFKMRLEELGDILEGEVAIRRMIVSFSPTMFQLSLLQRIKQHVFGQFLKSMRDFSKEGGIPFEDQIWNGDDTEEDEERGIPGPDYAQLLEELFRSLCGEDDSDSTLVSDQAVSIWESQIIG